MRAASIVLVALLAACGGGDGDGSGDAGIAPADAGSPDAGSAPVEVRIAQMNIKELSTDKLLDPGDIQVDAAAQILARFSADIVSINEIQYDMLNLPRAGDPGAPRTASPGGFDGGAENATRLADRIRAVAPGVDYPHTLLTVGNSGFYWDGDGTDEPSFVLRGWGDWEGRFNTAVLSRYPILVDQVRIIHDLAWETLPDNVIARMERETGLSLPAGFPLFEKSLNVVPIDVEGTTLYLVMLHPTAPVFDPINPYRHHDELHALALFLDGALPGVEPLPEGARFVVIGDLNADPEDGESLDRPIAPILEHPALVVQFPTGAGSGGSNPERNTYISGCGNDDGAIVTNPSSRFQLQLDYILPSVTIGPPRDMFLFFPDRATDPADFDLACHASDHRLVYADLEL